MTDFDFDAFAQRDSACDDTAGVSSLFAELLGLDQTIVSTEVALVHRTVSSEASYLKLAEEDFNLLRQTVVFELKLLGQSVAHKRVRNLVRALQVCGLASLGAMAMAFKDVNALRTTVIWEGLPEGIAHSDGDSVLSIADSIAVMGLRDSIVDARSAQKAAGLPRKPTRTVDRSALLVQHGFDAWPRDSAPS